MARTSSFEEVEQLFISNVGNPPNDMFQFLNFCKQQNIACQYQQIKTWWNQNKLNHNIPQIPPTLQHRTPIPHRKSKSKPSQLLANPSKFMAILKTEIQNYQHLLLNYTHLTRNHNNSTMIHKLMHHYQSFLTTLIKLKDAHKMHHYLKTRDHTLHPDIQLLWRIHLAHPVLYKQHCQRLFGFVLYPNYSCLNLTHTTKTNGNVRSFKRKSKSSVVMKQIFESIAFESKIKSYLLYMHKIVHMVDCQTDINTQMVNEYSEYIRFLAQSKYLNINHSTARAQEVIDVRIQNLSRFLPTLKQSFLWCTHAVFPKTFHHELHRKLSKYKEYNFFDLNRIAMHDEYISNKLWQTMQDDKMPSFEKDNVVQSLIQARNNEYLVCGYVEIQSLSIKYLIPMEVINLIVTFYNTETAKVRTANYFFEDVLDAREAKDRYHEERLRYYEERRHLNLYSFTGRYVVYGATMVPVRYQNASRYYTNYDCMATPLYG